LQDKFRPEKKRERRGESLFTSCLEGNRGPSVRLYSILDDPATTIPHIFFYIYTFSVDDGKESGKCLARRSRLGAQVHLGSGRPDCGQGRGTPGADAAQQRQHRCRHPAGPFTTPTAAPSAPLSVCRQFDHLSAARYR